MTIVKHFPYRDTLMTAAIVNARPLFRLIKIKLGSRQNPRWFPRSGGFRPGQDESSPGYLGGEQIRRRTSLLLQIRRSRPPLLVQRSSGSQGQGWNSLG